MPKLEDASRHFIYFISNVIFNLGFRKRSVSTKGDRQPVALAILFKDKLHDEKGVADA